MDAHRVERDLGRRLGGEEIGHSRLEVGALSTLDQVLDQAEAFAPEPVGVVVDTYHV